jgi:hypothetical protein
MMDGMPTQPKPRLRWVTVPLEWVLALAILFEEWGWEPLQDLMSSLARWPAIAWLEHRVAALPPAMALVAFVLPSLTMLPVNLLGLWMMGQGQPAAGTSVIVGAKLLTTTLVARVFVLTRPALLQMDWFARFYHRWQVWEAALLEPVRASWIWRKGRELKARWREWKSKHLGKAHAA